MTLNDYFREFFATDDGRLYARGATPDSGRTVTAVKLGGGISAYPDADDLLKRKSGQPAGTSAFRKDLVGVKFPSLGFPGTHAGGTLGCLNLGTRSCT